MAEINDLHPRTQKIFQKFFTSYSCDSPDSQGKIKDDIMKDDISSIPGGV